MASTVLRCLAPAAAAKTHVSSSKVAASRPLAATRSAFQGSTTTLRAVGFDNRCARGGLVIRSAVEVPSEDAEREARRKVNVVLGPYQHQSIEVKVKREPITADAVDAALKAKQAATYRLERVNFTGSGAKLGHTVKVNFEGTYVEGDQAGMTIKGTKAAMFELDLEEGRDAPWCDFVDNIVKNGMGQEESKTFMTQFPGDYKAATLRNVRARFTVTVKEISKKVPLDADARPEEEQVAELQAQMEADAQRRANDAADSAIREVLQASSQADVQKVADSVSWAKFGEKSLADFAWSMIMEEVAAEQGIGFEDVKAFLRSEAKIEWV